MKRPDVSIGSPSEFSASVTMKSEGFESIMSKIQDEAIPEKQMPMLNKKLKN